VVVAVMAGALEADPHLSFTEQVKCALLDLIIPRSLRDLKPRCALHWWRQLVRRQNRRRTLRYGHGRTRP
jgi:hypothetical protein